jgi:Fic family protein
MEREGLQDGAPGRLVAARVLERSPGDRIIEHKGQAFVPDDLPPRVDLGPILARQVIPLMEAARALGRLDGMDSQSPVLRPIWLREVRSSSAIENTVASAEEVMLAAVGHRYDREAPREVLNHLRALEHGLASEAPFSRQLVHDMHRLLMQDVRGGQLSPGAFRTGQVYIGDPRRGFAGARFVPPPATEVGRLMADLERFVTEPPADIPRLVAIGIAHYQFEAIHPFRDGNGRLGRLLVSRALCREGLLGRPLVTVSASIDANRSRYYELLRRVSTHGDWESWLAFFIEMVRREAVDVARRSDMLRALREDFVRRLEATRITPGMLPLLDVLFERPATTAALVAERLGVTDMTARRYIEKLEQAGILHEATGRDYAKRYVAPEIIDLIELDLPRE